MDIISNSVVFQGFTVECDLIVQGTPWEVQKLDFYI